MKIEIDKNRNFVLKDVFNSVMFETDEGEILGVCMRDGGFEISVLSPGDTVPEWYVIKDGEVTKLGYRVEDLNPDLENDMAELVKMLNDVEDD